MGQMMVAFIFDSGRMGTIMYGQEVFKFMFQGKELTRNSNKMVISHGDLNPKQTFAPIHFLTSAILLYLKLFYKS